MKTLFLISVGVAASLQHSVVVAFAPPASKKKLAFATTAKVVSLKQFAVPEDIFEFSSSLSSSASHFESAASSLDFPSLAISDLPSVFSLQGILFLLVVGFGILSVSAPPEEASAPAAESKPEIIEPEPEPEPTPEPEATPEPEPEPTPEPEPASAPAPELVVVDDAPVDLSIPYDAAALLAYKAEKGVDGVVDSSDFEAFKAIYYEKAVAEVVAKKVARRAAAATETTAKAAPAPAPPAPKVVEEVVDLSIPYDAAALLAFKAEIGSEPGDAEEFEKYKAVYYQRTVTEVVAKKEAREAALAPAKAPVSAPAPAPAPKEKIDVSIPYNAAAMLAYKAEKGTDPVDADDFAKFKAEYYEKTVAMVVAKKEAREGKTATPAAAPAKAPEPEPVVVVDLSIPYDAAAMLVFKAETGKDATTDAAEFSKFKADYYEKSVAEVVAKKVAREGGSKSAAPAPKETVTAPAPAPAEESVAVVDISVPYDATARLAYKAANGFDPTDGEEFEKFKAEYYDKAVTEVILKRQLAATTSEKETEPQQPTSVPASFSTAPAPTPAPDSSSDDDSSESSASKGFGGGSSSSSSSKPKKKGTKK